MLEWLERSSGKVDATDQAAATEATAKNLVLPGDVFSEVGQFVRGHGTYLSEDDQLVASVAGKARQLNKLVCVEPLNTVFNGQVGDTVVGRVTEVLQRRWKVDINARRDAVLALTSVNLPGGELRRKSEEDERLMRTNLCEGDLAEVQNVFADGSLALQTRSLKYGKLFQGVLVKVPPFLVRRCRMHFATLPCGAFVIFGLNGYIWISQGKDPSIVDTGSFVDTSTAMEKADFEVIARLRMCVLLLAKYRVSLYHKSLQKAYALSLIHKTSHLLYNHIAVSIAQTVRQAIIDALNMSILVESHRDALVVQLAKLLKMQMREVLKANKRCVIGLSGGSLPALLYDVFRHPTLADMPMNNPNVVRYVFCDERVVPFSSAESTYGEYMRTVVSRLPQMNAAAFLPINPSLQVEQCAKDYEERLKTALSVEPDKVPVIDVALLGVGLDGHTCSLFPGHALLQEEKRWVAPVKDSPKPPPERVTLTLPVIRNARCVIYVATGASKAHIVKRILKDHDDSLPARLASPSNNNLFWVLDEEAAGRVVPRPYNAEENASADISRLSRTR